MTNREYWQRRFEQLEQREMDKADKAMADLKKVYEYTLRQLRDEVIEWYTRYADENGLSLADARKQLDARELKAFKLTLKEYEKLAKQQDLSDEYIKMLDQASIRARLSRSQMLYIKTANYVEQLAKQQEINLTELLKDVYEDSYYRTAYETQSMQGAYDTFSEVPKTSVEKAISKPWAEDGKDFSERIWDNKTKLLNTLQSEITRTLIAAEGTTLLAGRIANRFNVSFSNARRLAETETAYVQETARMDTWQKLHVAKYELIATLDSRTSPICREMDGKVFARADAKPGVTMPPFHCYCRTTTAPYIEGITDDDDSTRAARDPETGKTVQVPGKMSYTDWKAVYVDKSKTLEEWRKHNGKKEDSASELVNNDNKSTLDIQVEKFLKGELSDRKLLGEEILKEYSVTGVPVNIQTMLDNGYCSMLIDGDRLKIVDYNLAANDARGIKYQLKTAFHEAYHASGNGYETDYSSTHSVRWLNLEETFAEVTAHYKVSLYGVTDLTPAYADKLVSMLPRLKQLPEFSSCVKPIDFGKVALDKRLNGGGSVWVPLSKKVMRRKFSFADYVTQYFSEIRGDIEGYVDKILENMPSCASSKRYMIADLEKAMGNVEKFGHTLSDNESLMLNNAVAVAMNRIGVK